jgi:serine/threonine-protein kinase ATR
MVGRLLAHNIARGPAAFGGDDLSDANLPPPSTLAAQLVKNHVDTARGLNQPDTTVTFRQLLQEILNKTSVPETDVDVNHKLVKVVVEAGLDVLFQNDPFAQWDFLIPQAVDSLAVIQSTVQRQPDILFHNASSDSDQHSHLLLWLFPKLLMIAKHPKGHQLQDSLASLMSSLVLSLSKTLDLWPYAKALLQMLRDCVTDLFLLLQDSRIFSNAAAQVPAVLLPPVRSASNTWPGSENNPALSLGHQLSTNDPLSATRIQLLLVSTLRSITSAKSTLTRFQTSTFPLHKWLSDSVTRLNRILFQHKSWFEQQSFFSAFALQIVCLQNFVLDSSSYPAVHNRTSYMLGSLCECCSRLIVHDGKPLLDAELQKELVSTIEKLIDRYDAEYGYIIEEFLLPSLRVFAHDSSKFEAASESLRRVVHQCLRKHETPDQVDTVMTDRVSQPRPEVSALQLAKTESSRRGLQDIYDPGHERSSSQSEDLYQKLKLRVATLLGKGSGAATNDSDVV